MTDLRFSKRSDSLFYLLGLICGKGNILNNKDFSISFNHKDKYVEGLAHCPECNWLATKTKIIKPDGLTGFSDFLKCKNPDCKNSKTECIDRKIKKIYNQKELAQKSIEETIIPFLKKNISFKHETLSTDSSTILIIEDVDKKICEFIINFFQGKTGFDNFEINSEFYKEKLEFKAEFINGILDTCGFFNQGGWYVSKGKNGNTRMRVYLQIVRNWKMPIQIDNFLRENFNITTQTIRWGHPNIVDPGLDYFHHQQSPKGAFKEHQVKIFPELLKNFTVRLEPKKSLFKELLTHNIKVDFSNQNEDWLLSKKEIINDIDIKPYHPLNNDIRIPAELRGKHINASWQVSLLMGCKFLKEEKKKCRNKKIYEIAGNINETNFEKINSKIDLVAKKKFEEIINSQPKKLKTKTRKKTKGFSELDTYKPLIEWLKEYIRKKFKEESEVFDTSSQTLANYFSMNFKNSKHFREKIKNLDELKIRPDVIGISNKSNKMFFIESKITALGVKELGQIWAYSVLANPFQSFLISTKEISISLLKAYAQNKDKKFLNFDKDKKIILGRLDINKKGVKLFNV